ncbi:MAG: tRNA (guanosine(46)-N7)-methyltransferase TrmB, partial [Clostridia bacterium]|nr:tRNA (guanosine(46)-N7)-methyltransferase TrmB [Clostridia bacterium]
MRLRLKKHLNEREDNVKEYLIECGNLEANHIEAAKNKQYLDVFELFGNDNPIVLEIGCGMGAFAVGYCKQNKGVNLVGVEMIR